MAERELLHSIEIAAPIEAVWAELTRLDGRQRAMMDTVLESSLEVGAPLYYKSPDGKRVFIVGGWSISTRQSGWPTPSG